MTDKKPVFFQLINPRSFVVKLYSTSCSKQTQLAQISKVNSFLLFTESKKGGTPTCNEVLQHGSKAM